MLDSLNTHSFSAHQLAKRYKQRSVVEDVSFSVKSGEVIGLLGPMVLEKPPPST